MRIKLEEGWTTLLLLLVMMYVAAAGVAKANFFDGLNILINVGIMSALAGVLLAKSRFDGRTAHLFSFIYGTFFVFYSVGSVLPGDLVWRERVFEIINIQVVWLQKLVSGGTGREGYVFVLHTAVIFWILGYTAAWNIFRQLRIWQAIVPTGVVLLSVVYYYAGPEPLALYLAIYILLALMLVVRTHLNEQEKRWRISLVRYDPTIWIGFLRAGLIASLVALLISWFIPSMSASAAVGDALSNTRGPWREFQNTWTRLYSALHTYGTPTIDPYQETLVLGGPRSVGDTPVMDVYVERQLPYVYWQTIVYDTYDDGRWQIAKNESTLHISDDGLLQVPETRSRQVITQTVVNYLPNSSLIYGAPEVVGSNRDLFVSSADDGNGNALITGVRSRFVLKQGDRYDVVSRFSTADATSLRAAGTSYPDWVADTYLQVPDTLSEETLDLAEAITAVYDTPFDKALAVRDYLRETITYNDQIPAPPTDIDPVHYILFVSQEGYCNYYASAMVMLLRSQGVPARIVSGYAQGEFNEDNSFYRVRASNAHTWVEVYFPNYGWIQFEPTAAIPTVDRPEQISGAGGGDAFDAFNNARNNFLSREELLDEGVEEFDPSELQDLLREDFESGQSETAVSPLANIPIWQIVTGVLLLGGAVAVTMSANAYNKRVEADVERSYTRLEGWGRWMGIGLRETQTPYERAEEMGTAVPAGKQSILNLTRQFVLKQFSQAKAYDDGFDPTDEWRILRPILLRQTVENWVKNLRERGKRRK